MNRFKPNEYQSVNDFCNGEPPQMVYKLADADADGT